MELHSVLRDPFKIFWDSGIDTGIARLGTLKSKAYNAAKLIPAYHRSTAIGLASISSALQW